MLALVVVAGGAAVGIFFLAAARTAAHRAAARQAADQVVAAKQALGEWAKSVRHRVFRWGPQRIFEAQYEVTGTMPADVGGPFTGPPQPR